MPADHFDVIVTSAIERDDEITAVAEAASAVEPEEVLASASDGDTLATEALRRAAVEVAGRMGLQREIARKQVDGEAKALRSADPTTVKAITNEDIAAKRARKIEEGA